MHTNRNTPAVGLETRRWLYKKAREEDVLDLGSLTLIEKSIAKCARVSPAGMVHDLAIHLGAPSETALLTASVVEMFYAVCSLTDDIQDGDATAYLGDVPLPLQINALTHLLCLVAVRCQDLEALIKSRRSSEIVTEVYRVGATMLTGQRVEIERSPWKIEQYERVARMSAGVQYGLYFQLAAECAEAEEVAWIDFGRAFGTLLQLASDMESEDLRLTVLDKNDTVFLKDGLIRELRDVAAPLGDFAVLLAEGLVRRCR